VAAPVEARCGKARFREAALFTHRGLSGPAILQVSSYWSRGQAVTIDFLPDRAPGWLLEAKRARPRAGLRSVLGEALPDRLATALAGQLGLGAEMGNLPDKALRAAEERLGAWDFMPNGSEGFAKAEVTAGGSAPPIFRRRRWRRAKCPASMRLARRSM
jgi:predicted flavoprotein YhiN